MGGSVCVCGQCACVVSVCVRTLAMLWCVCGQCVRAYVRDVVVRVWSRMRVLTCRCAVVAGLRDRSVPVLPAPGEGDPASPPGVAHAARHQHGDAEALLLEPGQEYDERAR